MARFRLLFLIFVVVASSGYRFRCYWLCVDQTAVQNDYVEQRDKCRDFAQSKLDMAMRTVASTNDDKTRKDQLVALFNQCMSENGWNVADNKEKSATTAAAAAAAAKTGTTPSAATTPPASADVAEKMQAKANLARHAECDFLRANASASSISAKRAEACDLECAESLRVAPGAPRPPACPSGPTPKLGNGNERVD